MRLELLSSRWNRSSFRSIGKTRNGWNVNRALLAAMIALLGVRTAVASDFATEVVEATFKFFDPDCTSTCFLVRREVPDTAYYLVTTAHSMERTKKETAIVVLRRQKPDGSYVRHDYTIPIRRADKPLWVRHEKEDVSVLRLAQPLPVPVRALPFGALADEGRLNAAGLHVCSSLFVLTYPQCFEASDAGFPVARMGIIASHPFMPIQPHHRFLADFTTFAGDSGGPVFVSDRDGRPLLIGIVLAQFRHDEKVTMEYEERMIHHPLELGTVLYAPYVRDTIEKAAKQADKSDTTPFPRKETRQ